MDFLNALNSFAWGPVMITFLVGTGVILSIGTGFVQFRKLAQAFRLLFSKNHVGDGGITPFQALMTSLSATIGTGNIAGVATAIAHAASSNNNPYTQGLIASLSPLIDTLIICTMTALVILVSGLVTFGPDGMMAITDGLNGAALTSRAFELSLPGLGKYIVSLGLIFFAFSTILGWFYYGSKCLEYIAGVKAVSVYKWLWVIFVFVGATLKIGIVWNLSDTFNGLMAIPNLIALIALAPVIFTLTKEAKLKS